MSQAPVLFEVVITATGEVRDAEGNLISAEPVEFREQVSEADLRASGVSEDQIEAIKRGEHA